MQLRLFLKESQVVSSKQSTVLMTAYNICEIAFELQKSSQVYK